MGFTDKHGRPELVAQPFIAKGTADWRVVDTSEVEEDQEPDEPTTTAGADDSDRPAGPTPA